MDLAIPKAAVKHERLFNKPASDAYVKVATLKLTTSHIASKMLSQHHI
jgi:hypothetical protein